VTLADATTALLQQGQVVWRRAEALSCVLASRFVVRIDIGVQRVQGFGFRVWPRQGAELRAGLPLRGVLIITRYNCLPRCSAAVNQKHGHLHDVHMDGHDMRAYQGLADISECIVSGRSCRHAQAAPSAERRRRRQAASRSALTTRCSA
jgi:hypothetical protein